MVSETLTYFSWHLNPAVQPARMPWLMRLAKLARRRRVVMRAGVFGDAYRRLLRRAKIAFSYVENPRPSRRHAEAAASGSLLFEHVRRADEVAPLKDRESCVLYDDDNLEALIEHYLDHDEERERLTAAARGGSGRPHLRAALAEALDGLDRDLPALSAHSRNRASRPAATRCSCGCGRRPIRPRAPTWIWSGTSTPPWLRSRTRRRCTTPRAWPWRWPTATRA